MKNLAIILVGVFLAAFVQAEEVTLTKEDYAAFVVGNYVHGFKEFETSVTTLESSVSVGIYFDKSTQSEARANQLADRFRKQIPLILKRYEWAKGFEVVVSVYSEDLTGRGY